MADSSLIKRPLAGYLFILPFFLFFVAFNLYTIGYSLFLSFTHYDAFNPPVWVGFENYARLIQDSRFWDAFANTWKIWLPNIIMQLSLALFLAVVFTNRRPRIRGMKFFRSVFYFPNLITMASVALLFMVLLDWQHGALNQLLFGENQGEYIHWLRHPDRARFIISLIQTWMWFGYTLIIFIAGIQGISPSYYESAIVEGANGWQTFSRITLPLLRPIMAFVVITSLIGGMQLFDVPHVITGGTGGRGNALVTNIIFMYNAAFTHDQIGYGASVAWGLFVLILAFSLIYIKLVGIKAEGE